jgi:hypothetical protein
MPRLPQVLKKAGSFNAHVLIMCYTLATHTIECFSEVSALVLVLKSVR